MADGKPTPEEEARRKEREMLENRLRQLEALRAQRAAEESAARREAAGGVDPRIPPEFRDAARQARAAEELERLRQLAAQQTAQGNPPAPEEMARLQQATLGEPVPVVDLTPTRPVPDPPELRPRDPSTGPGISTERLLQILGRR